MTFYPGQRIVVVGQSAPGQHNHTVRTAVNPRSIPFLPSGTVHTVRAIDCSGKVPVVYLAGIIGKQTDGKEEGYCSGCFSPYEEKTTDKNLSECIEQFRQIAKDVSDGKKVKSDV